MKKAILIILAVLSATAMFIVGQLNVIEWWAYPVGLLSIGYLVTFTFVNFVRR